MSNRSLKITDIAICDMGAIADFAAIGKRNGAKEVLKLLYETFNMLCSHIRMGMKRPDLTDKDVMFFCVKKNWLIVYNFDEHTLCILRVLANYKDICETVY